MGNYAFSVGFLQSNGHNWGILIMYLTIQFGSVLRESRGGGEVVQIVLAYCLS